RTLRDSRAEWDGMEIFELKDLLREARELALQDVENRLFQQRRKDLLYLEMRQDQLQLLRQMIKVIAVVSTSDLPVKEQDKLADFMEDTSRHVHSGDTTERSLERLEEMMVRIRASDLPQSREEFEVRANLYSLVLEMENYFKIKRRLFNRT